MATVTVAVYDLQPRVKNQLKQIVDSKKTLENEELKKRLAILDTRLCMAPCAVIMHDFYSYKSNDRQWFNEPFYTGPRGYKLCLGIFANGYGTAHGSYVSVGVYMMWGENDDILDWPASGSVGIEVKSNTWSYSSCTASISLGVFTSPVTSGERSANGYGTLDYIPLINLPYYTEAGKLNLRVTFSA